jgi:6-phosphogluconolactonase
VLAEVAGSPARDAVDWHRVHLWWGDERYLPAGHADRNETQARRALLDRLDLDPARVHPVPASDDEPREDVEAAAARYAEELRAASRPEDPAEVPAFDVVLLGVGPDGHCASLFPEHPAVHETQRTVVGVHGAPKPPPTRVSLTFPALDAAQEVWFVVSGADKAPAVTMALSGAGRVQVPAAGPRGRRRTLWLLDRAAAGGLPGDLAG